MTDYDYFKGLLDGLESYEFSKDFGIASGKQMARNIALRHPMTKAVRKAIRADRHELTRAAHSRIVTLAYEPIDDKYENPKDCAAFTLLLLLEQEGYNAREFEGCIYAASKIPNTWWTKKYVEDYRSKPRCRHCYSTGHDDTGMKPGLLCQYFELTVGPLRLGDC